MNKQQFTFGDQRNYCAAPIPPGKDQLSPFEKRVMELLCETDSELRERVERTVKQWNQIVREYLRSETALRLSVGDDQQAVPIRVMDGVPVPFEQSFRGIRPEIWRLYLNRALLGRTLQGLQLIGSEYYSITGSLVAGQVAPPGAIKQTHAFLSDAIASLDKQDLLKKLMTVPEDILGAYFFRVPEIHLYWVVIGLVASVLDVSPEGLTVVVLVHELAHAYTHLGKDILTR